MYPKNKVLYNSNAINIDLGCSGAISCTIINNYL